MTTKFSPTGEFRPPLQGEWYMRADGTIRFSEGEGRFVSYEILRLVTEEQKPNWEPACAAYHAALTDTCRDIERLSRTVSGRIMEAKDVAYTFHSVCELSRRLAVWEKHRATVLGVLEQLSTWGDLDAAADAAAEIRALESTPGP